MSKSTKKEKLKLFIAAAGAVVLVFAALSALLVAVYKYDSTNRFVRFFEKKIPFPAVYIRGAGFISINEIKDNTAAVRKFYESQDFEQIGMRVDFSTDQGQKRLKIKEKEIVNKMIENKIIQNLAKKRGISISDQLVGQQVEDSVNQFGNREKLMSELARLYGWTLSDFQEKAVKPELYAESLTESFASEINTDEQKKKIDSLWERVAQKKEDFAKVAAEASEGKSAENGGDLGWSTKDQLIDPVAEKAYSMKTGEISDVISSPLGFHIVKLEEKKSEEDQELVRLRQIFVKTATFSDWLKEKMKDYRMVVFLRDYRWSQNEAIVEFADSALSEFEKNTSSNSQGDPSVFP
ncbi:MAG: hypothetical protein A3J76_00250 [Candidatus Moranbacteria bacterium RBG_13_45_13]|nr:MAG: hypothetical protein A3J76_00250 [Candidatus Moranbacteria bacterium RBG_13_45_13]